MIDIATKKGMTPLDRMCAAFPDAHEKSNGFWANEDRPRFDWRVLENGDIRIKSWTGRTDDDILSMGQIPLTRADLYAKKGHASAFVKRDKIDILMLAEYMCIDWQFLQREGYSDGYLYEFREGGTVNCIKLGGICAPDGQENPKHQVRLSLHKEPRFLWNWHTPGNTLPSGLHYLDRARAAGYLFIGEGNSDWATMTFHGIPFIGIPGSDQAKTLDVELVKDIPVIYLIEEPDQVKKLQKSGQGFYKNMHQHLRTGGYQGEIYSIRFMEATGYKDPSDLHKAIYTACKEQAEGPFRQEVHKCFIEAIERALEQAIPEGNAGLFPVAKSRDWSQITFEDFSKQVWAVPSDFLSPIQKMIVCYLFLYMREVEPDEELGWPVDAGQMAPKVGLRGKKGKKQFLEHLSYIHQNVGILNKEHRAIKEYVNGEDGDEQVRYKGMTLYIQAIPSFYTPGGYCVITQDQHKPGGPRLPIEECELCGSKHLKHYAVQCVDCGYVMYPPIEQDEPLPLEKVIDSTSRKQEEKSSKMELLPEQAVEQPVESVEEVQECVTLRTTNEDNPGYPKLGYPGNEQEECNIESITIPQIGVSGNDDSPLFPEPEPEPGVLVHLTVGQMVHGPDGWAYVKRVGTDDVDLEHFGTITTYPRVAIAERQVHA